MESNVRFCRFRLGYGGLNFHHFFTPCAGGVIHQPVDIKPLGFPSSKVG